MAQGWSAARKTARPAARRDAATRQPRACRPAVLIGAGRFADDVTMARERRRLPPDTRVALVAAGIAAFGREARAAAEGIIGPSQ